MADNAVINLDDGLSEYFEFILLGGKYRFRYLTLQEAEEAEKLQDDSKSLSEVMEHFGKFIDSVDNAPPFTKIYKKMTVAHVLAFTDMVKNKLSNENQG